MFNTLVIFSMPCFMYFLYYQPMANFFNKLLIIIIIIINSSYDTQGRGFKIFRLIPFPALRRKKKLKKVLVDVIKWTSGRQIISHSSSISPLSFGLRHSSSISRFNKHCVTDCLELKRPQEQMNGLTCKDVVTLPVLLPWSHWATADRFRQKIRTRLPAVVLPVYCCPLNNPPQWCCRVSS